MEEYLTSTDILFVKDTPYKPFWFGQHMYFTNIYTGQLFKENPIYLGCSSVADLSQLKNYFRENDIEFFDGELALSQNFKRIVKEGEHYAV